MITEFGDDYANNLPATELREGDVFYIGGQYQEPGQAVVVSDDIGYSHRHVFLTVKIPRGHVFDYVQRVPR